MCIRDSVHRIQQVLDAAAACGRKVAVTGRSMENIMNCLLYTSRCV